MYFLPRRVGLAMAKELIFSGRKVDAAEALKLGIASRVSPPERLLADACAWAAELGAGFRPGARSGQGHPGQELRTQRRGSVRPGQPGPGHLLHQQRAPGLDRGLPCQIGSAHLGGAQMNSGEAIARLLRPRSVAVVGASADLSKTSGRPVAYLQKHGFAGAIYPVNPRVDRVAGLPCYPDVAALPRSARRRTGAAGPRARA